VKPADAVLADQREGRFVRVAAPRVTMMGLPVHRLTETEVIDLTLRGVEEGRGGWICPVNLDVLRQVVREEELHGLVTRADIVVADGMPLVWASRLQRAPLPERVAGSSLAVTLPAAAADAGISVFLLGGDPGVAETAAQRLCDANPGLRLAGTHCPPVGFEQSPADMAALHDALDRAKPDIVFVALGFPKQDYLIAALRERHPSTWFVSCGISLSFLSGDVARAPRWIQRAGLEWLHRLAQEPRRLFRRYLVEGVPFLARLLVSALRQRGPFSPSDAR
jgi:N-acetylglucosaminyldiphosphoundecaprenol N-acetyl-beta-D-mannosaminyltransferase